MTWLSELEDFIIKKKKEKRKEDKEKEETWQLWNNGNLQKIENATKTNKFLNYIRLYKF